MLRATPPGEDATKGAKGRAVPALVDAMPPGEDNVTGEGPGRQAYNQTGARAGSEAQELKDFQRNSLESHDKSFDFLKVVTEAEEQALLYTNQANRRAWSDALKAWHNEHYNGSKYNRSEWRNRSKLFVPKTRSGVRKDMAAVSASLFGSLDAVTCTAGNESDAKQRAAAAVMQELINFRTKGTSVRAHIPWFLTAMGARQDAMITGICMTKQYWKLDLKKVGDTWRPWADRPDIHLFPPENFTIDPAADWTNPAQSAAFLILKYPMRLNEIEEKMAYPIPEKRWKKVPQDILDSSIEMAKYDLAAIRRARESGLDRYDETQTGYKFKVIWVFENFMRLDGDDWHFWSVGDKAYLTEPVAVADEYPEQFGERPVVMGYGAIDAHRIFPMAPVDSWRPLQTEINDLRNLALDQVKQNVMPITKVVRGRQIDVDQVKRRSYGSSIIVTNKDDVTWEQPPSLPSSVPTMNRELELEFDDVAGQFNSGTTENNNALSRTLGGLKLVAGSANAVQEFDIRLWITTWGDPVLAQLVNLEQYYESDPIVLGICGDRAQLFTKYGISQITDDLLEQEVTINVSIGLGAGDPQQRLAKFQSAVQIAGPLAAQSPEFQSGEWQIDVEAVFQEVFGAAGYRDGGMRFIKKGQPKPNPMGDLPMQELQSKIAKNYATAKGAMLTGLAAAAKVELGNRELEAMTANQMLDHYMNATKMGTQHAHDLHDRLLAATEHGHRHGMAITQHKHEQRKHNLAERQHAHKQLVDHTNMARDAAQQQFDNEQSADQQQFDQETQGSQQQFDQDMQGRQQDHAEQQASQPQAGGGGKGPSVAAPAPPQPPAPDMSGVEEELDDLKQAVGQLTVMVQKLLQAQAQQQQPQGGFPARPYGPAQ